MSTSGKTAAYRIDFQQLPSLLDPGGHREAGRMILKEYQEAGGR